MRVLRPIVVTILCWPLILGLVVAHGQERLISRKDADRIFGLRRPLWEAEARQWAAPPGWTVRLVPVPTGTGVVVMDPKTGTGLGVQPLFRNAQGPPDMLVVESYYPAGTFREFSEQTQKDMQAATSLDLGPAYTISVSFNRMDSPPPGFDVIEVTIKRIPR
jgi:hypothetical protein